MTEKATELLQAWRDGDLSARNEVVALLYAELHAIARGQFGQERASHTLQPTALVHEAYQRLIKLDRIDWQDRNHFFAMAARLMRRVLVDHARARQAAKRDGGRQVTLLTHLLADEENLDLLALEEALLRLEGIAPDRARVVELRYFGGLSIEETAAALEVSPATVKRHWRSARLWLSEALS